MNKKNYFGNQFNSFTNKIKYYLDNINVTNK